MTATAERAGRRTVFAAGALAAALVAVGAWVPWVTVPGTGALVGGAATSVRGADLVPALLPLALVIAVGVVVGLVTGSVARWIGAVLIAAAGVAVAVLAIRGLTDHSGLLTDWELAGAGRRADAAASTWGPFGPLLAVVGGVAAVVTAALQARAGWAVSRRFERTDTTMAGVAADSAAPSPHAENAGESPNAATPRAAATGPAVRSATRPARELSAWERLDRGEDPFDEPGDDQPGGGQPGDDNRARRADGTVPGD